MCLIKYDIGMLKLKSRKHKKLFMNETHTVYTACIHIGMP